MHLQFKMMTMMIYLTKLNNICKQKQMFGAYQATLIHTRKIYSHMFTSTCPVVNRQLECRLWVFTSDMVIIPELCYSPPAVFDPCICNWYRQSLCSDVKLFLLQCLETGGVFTFSCRRSWCALKKWDANVLLAIWNKSERLIHANEWAMCQQERDVRPRLERGCHVLHQWSFFFIFLVFRCCSDII